MKNNNNKGAIVFAQKSIPFFDGAAIGIYRDPDDKIWFRGPDVAKLMGYDKPDHMYRMIDDDNKTPHNVGGSKVKVMSMSEAGFYQVALLSRTENGKKLMKYVCEVVLPDIRKNGVHIADTATPADIQFSIENKIIDRSIARARGEHVRVGDGIKQLLDGKSLDEIRKSSMPYITQKLTTKSVKGAKDAFFDCMSETVALWGNARFLAKKLEMADQYMIMALLKTCEESHTEFLKLSRAQSIRQLKNKIAA